MQVIGKLHNSNIGLNRDGSALFNVFILFIYLTV